MSEEMLAGKVTYIDRDTIFLKDELAEQVWLKAWCEVARSDACRAPSVATSWADICLKEFRVRFRK